MLKKQIETMIRQHNRFLLFLLPVMIFVGAFIMRFYHWQTYPFNFDQVQSK